MSPLQGAAKKMTQHVKMWLRGNSCKFLLQIWYDCLAGSYSPMCWFCVKLLHVYEIGITPNFKFQFCNYTSLYLLYVMLHSEQLLPNLLKMWKLSSVKLIRKRIHVCGLSLNRQQSLKVVVVSQNSANSWERWTRRKRLTACESETAACMRQLFAPFSGYCYQFWASLPITHINTFTYQFYGVQLPGFSSKFENNSTECNIT